MGTKAWAWLAGALVLGCSGSNGHTSQQPVTSLAGGNGNASPDGGGPTSTDGGTDGGQTPFDGGSAGGSPSWKVVGGALDAFADAGVGGGHPYVQGTQVAASADGQVFAAWVETAAGSGQPKVFVARKDAAGWTPLGAGMREDLESPWATVRPDISLALGPGASPWVAWAQATGPDDDSFISVRRWNGASWDAVSPPLSHFPDHQHALGPQLKIRPDGTPVLAWYESQDTGANTFTVYVARWTGSTWDTFGALRGDGAAEADVLAELPSLQLDASGNPWVAFLQDGSNSAPIPLPLGKSFVFAWNGSAWQQQGPGLQVDASAAGNMDPPRLALGPVGSAPVVELDEEENFPDGGHLRLAQVSRWAGGEWNPLGHSFSGPTYISGPLTQLSDGGILLALQQGNAAAGHSGAAVMSWDGTSWASLTSPEGLIAVSGSAGVQPTCLAADANGTPFLGVAEEVASGGNEDPGSWLGFVWARR